MHMEKEQLIGNNELRFNWLCSSAVLSARVISHVALTYRVREVKSKEKKENKKIS